MAYAKFFHEYLLTLLEIARDIMCNLRKLKHVPIFAPIAEFVVSFYYYYYCGLSSYTVVLNDQTTMHFWVSNCRSYDRPNLVLIHGCGGDAHWQFLLQVGSLSKSFNIYMPDLLFFGKSYTKSKDRTPQFQAKCVMEGLKKGFGVDTCTVYSISYGGWVGYWMAEIYPQQVERIVIVSTGLGSTVDQKREELKKKIMGKRIEELVVPRDPNSLRLLIKRAVHKYNLSWIPDFFLWEFIRMVDNKNMKGREELIEYLASQEPEAQLPTLSQETLLIWGEEDDIFPKHLGYQLQRLLGPKARLELIKGAGHAVNIDSPKELNELIKSFTLTTS